MPINKKQRSPSDTLIKSSRKRYDDLLGGAEKKKESWRPPLSAAAATPATNTITAAEAVRNLLQHEENSAASCGLFGSESEHVVGVDRNRAKARARNFAKSVGITDLDDDHEEELSVTRSSLGFCKQHQQVITYWF